jgi:hypothetical protein
MPFIPHPIPFLVGGKLPPAFVTPVHNLTTGTDATTYTHTNINFGEAHKTRRIFVIAGASNGTSGGGAVNSATIGGVAATIHLNNSQNLIKSSIFSAIVPTGASGTISITYAAAMFQHGIAVYSSYYLLDTAPFDTASDTSNALSFSLDIPDVGIIVAGGCWATTGGVTMTGVTEYQDTSDNRQFASGYATGLAAETARAISLSGASGDAAGHALSWF